MRLLSDLRTRRRTEMPALIRKCWARSDTPFSVITRSGLKATTSSHIFLMYSSSICRILLKAHTKSLGWTHKIKGLNTTTKSQHGRASQVSNFVFYALSTIHASQSTPLLSTRSCTHNITKPKDKAKISATSFWWTAPPLKDLAAKIHNLKKLDLLGIASWAFCSDCRVFFYNNFVCSILQLCQMKIWIMFSKVTAPSSFMDLHAKSVWGWFVVWCHHRS